MADIKAQFGQRLDARQYQQRMLALYRDSQSTSGAKAQAVLRRCELELTIDHKFGLDFPKERRNALWKAQQRVQRRHLSSVLIGFLHKALGSKKPIEEPLYRLVLREYGRVLTPAEMSEILDVPINDLGH